MMYFLQWIGVFLATFFADIAWTMYILKVSEKKAFQSATWGAAIFMFGAFATVNYIHDLTLLIPAVTGSFLGVYVIVRKQ